VHVHLPARVVEPLGRDELVRLHVSSAEPSISSIRSLRDAKISRTWALS